MQYAHRGKARKEKDIQNAMIYKEKRWGRKVGKGRERQKWSKQLNTIFNVGHLREPSPQQVSVILVRTIEGRNLSEEFRSFELELKEHKVCASFRDKSILTGSFIIVNERNTHGISCEIVIRNYRKILTIRHNENKIQKYPIMVKF